MQIVGTTSLATFLILLINHTFVSHVYSLTVYFVTDAIFLLPQHSASLTHTLCLSVILLSFPFFLSDIKTLGKPLHPIIVLNKLFRFTLLLFHLGVCSQYILWPTGLTKAIVYVSCSNCAFLHGQTLVDRANPGSSFQL
jgi:hypothetical protein